MVKVKDKSGKILLETSEEVLLGHRRGGLQWYGFFLSWG
jgi:hypothetical protein